MSLMRKLFAFLPLLLLLVVATPAVATNCNTAGGTCFWVGGTGTMDLATDSAHWSNTTGGASCSCEPTNSATLTFDASSGAGTVTAAGGTLAIGAITSGAYTGSLLFDTNNPNVNMTTATVPSFNNSGSGTRTINTGSGTWTITCSGCQAGTLWNWGTLTGCTCTASNSTINMTNNSGGTVSFNGGAPTGNYGTVGFAGKSGFTLSGATTFTTVNLTAPVALLSPNAVTTTITNNFNWTGSSSNWIYVGAASGTTTISVGAGSGTSTCTYCTVRATTFSGGGITFTGTNAIDLGINSGMSFTLPSFGGGGSVGIIGG
jgi:hypothetical protein